MLSHHTGAEVEKVVSDLAVVYEAWDSAAQRPDLAKVPTSTMI